MDAIEHRWHEYRREGQAVPCPGVRTDRRQRSFSGERRAEGRPCGRGTLFRVGAGEVVSVRRAGAKAGTTQRCPSCDNVIEVRILSTTVAA